MNSKNQTPVGRPVVKLRLIKQSQWLKTEAALSPWTRNWCRSQGFSAKPSSVCLVPGDDGTLSEVLAGIDEVEDSPWTYGHLPKKLPVATYAVSETLSDRAAAALNLGWKLGSYTYAKYKKAQGSAPALHVDERWDCAESQALAEAICWARDLINTPAIDLGPQELANAAQRFAEQTGASCSVIEDDVLQREYPAVYLVGQGSPRGPRMIDLQWGDDNCPTVVLVGKGVCFDSGGLNIKPHSAMKVMKKDMGGAAYVLALAQLIIKRNLPVHLRVLIPAVENSISGSAMRTLDVVRSRKGTTIEIGHTDAEGRVILADALEEASRADPALICDIATLTGAARIALGPDIPVLFTNNEAVAAELMTASSAVHDPVWRLPLHQPYRSWLDSSVADISNESSSSYGGAITGALFLQDFVKPTIPWAHLDVMAWNVKSSAGRPEGGDAMGLRALFEFIKRRFATK